MDTEKPPKKPTRKRRTPKDPLSLDWKNVLDTLHACTPARDYFLTNEYYDDNNPKSAWENCPNPDWMHWLLQELSYCFARRISNQNPWPTFDRDMRLAACDLAEEYIASQTSRVIGPEHVATVEHFLASARLYAHGERDNAKLLGMRDAAEKWYRQAFMRKLPNGTEHYDYMFCRLSDILFVSLGISALVTAICTCRESETGLPWPSYYQHYIDERREHPFCAVVRRHAPLELVVAGFRQLIDEDLLW